MKQPLKGTVHFATAKYMKQFSTINFVIYLFELNFHLFVSVICGKATFEVKRFFILFLPLINWGFVFPPNHLLKHFFFELLKYTAALAT